VCKRDFALPRTPSIVAFAAASYAGQLTITLVADPDAVPDLAILKRALVDQLAALAIPAVSSR
jgi:hypothetical protein